MSNNRTRMVLGRMLGGAGLVGMLLWPAGSFLSAQVRAPGVAPAAAQRLSPQQLDTLVAPVALYPDSLLSQVLVAATYPLEIVETNQWLQQNRNLSGPQLLDAARGQNWDASIQALVVFPDVLGRLASDARWTTDLGNAFLAQQADVMRAVQRMRARAQQEGRLSSNAQQTVTDESQGGQSAIDIQPANPEVVYVPEYNPESVWGPPEYGDYADLYYPDDFGFGFYPGVFIGDFFGGFGWGFWGWAPNWFACNVFLRPFFFQHFGFGGGFHGGGGHGGGVWQHDPGHRLGVAYPNRTLAGRFGGASAASARYAGGRVGASAGVAGSGGWQRFGQSAGGGQWHGFSGANSYQGYRSSSGSSSSSSYGAGRGYSGNAYYGGAHAAAGYRPSYGGGRSYGGGGYHYAAPSFHGGGGGYRGGGSSFHGGGGGGYHGSGGGGSHGSGGGSHGGGGRR